MPWKPISREKWVVTLRHLMASEFDWYSVTFWFPHDLRNPCDVTRGLLTQFFPCVLNLLMKVELTRSVGHEFDLYWFVFFNEDAFLYSLKVSFHFFYPHWLIASPIDLPFCTNWWFSFGTHEAANLWVLRWFAAIYFNGKEWLPSSAPRHLLNDGWTSNSFRTCKYYLIIFTYLINFNHGQLPFFIVYIQIICIG